jgi:hypothetical protein
MGAAIIAIFHGPKESISEEGRAIITVMLLVGLTFLAVIALGQLARWVGHRRRYGRR